MSLPFVWEEIFGNDTQKYCLPRLEDQQTFHSNMSESVIPLEAKHILILFYFKGTSREVLQISGELHTPTQHPFRLQAGEIASTLYLSCEMCTLLNRHDVCRQGPYQGVVSLAGALLSGGGLGKPRRRGPPCETSRRMRAAWGR